MKRTLAPLLLAVLVLAGCTATPEATAVAPQPTLADARENCLTAYRELPHSIETLSQQSGEDADTATPCDNWVESQGEAAFIDFWTTPATFIPYVISEGKLEGVAAVG